MILQGTLYKLRKEKPSIQTMVIFMSASGGVVTFRHLTSRSNSRWRTADFERSFEKANESDVLLIMDKISSASSKMMFILESAMNSFSNSGNVKDRLVELIKRSPKTMDERSFKERLLVIANEDPSIVLPNYDEILTVVRSLLYVDDNLQPVSNAPTIDTRSLEFEISNEEINVVDEFEESIDSF